MTAPSAPPSSPDGFVEGKSVEVVSKRTETSKFFRNPDGTYAAELSMVPVHYRDPIEGGWVDIDTSLVADRSHPGWVRMRANSWGVRFGPLPDGGVVVTDTTGATQSFALRDAAAVKPVIGPEKNQVTYAEVYPGIDLRYTVSAVAVREEIVLKRRTDRSSFEFDTKGLDYEQSSDGRMAPVGRSAAAGTLAPPEVYSAADGQPLPEAEPALEAISRGVSLSVSRDWLAGLPPSAYPVVIDPDVNIGSANMMACGTAAGCSGGWGLRVGNSRNGGDTYWRSIGYFDYTGLYGTRILDADVQVTRGTGTNLGTDFNVWWASAYSFAGAAPGNGWDAWVSIPPWSVAGAGPFWAGGQTLAQQFNYWVANGIGGAALGFSGTETPGAYTYNRFDDFRVLLTYDRWPTMASATQPTNGASIHNAGQSPMPTLGASATDPDGDTVQYYYRVALGSDAESQQVWNSNWTTASSVQIPTGVLAWNTTYYWHVYTWDGKWDAHGNAMQTNPNWVQSFSTSDAPPTAVSGTKPTAGAVVTTTNLTFTSTTATDPESDPVSYQFQVATGADGQTGRLATSLWQTSATWTPPVGTFADGGTYTYVVRSGDDKGVYSPWSAPIQFRIDLGLGRRANQPYDELGPAAVNLSNGNLTLQAGGPEFSTVGGSIGVSFTYNSQAPAVRGLNADYHPDLNHNGTNDTNEGALAHRIDTSASFDYGTLGPAPGVVRPDWWVLHWTGGLRVPLGQDGQWVLVATVDDSVKVKVNGSDVLTQAACCGTNVVSSAFALSSSAATPLDVVYGQATGPQYLKLKIRKQADPAGSEYDIPADWLTPTLPTLPDGWSRTGDGFAGGFSALRLVSATVTAAVDDSGADHLFTATGSSWMPPTGEDEVLTQRPDGSWSLLEEDGTLSLFDAGGRLQSVTQPADDIHPAAPIQTWGTPNPGGPLRLLSITDAVGAGVFGQERKMVLTYGPSGSCPGGGVYDTTAPANMVCKVEYPGFDDVAITDLYYSNGHLARIVNPDGATTDFGYDTAGRLVSVRDTFTNDLIAHHVITDGDDVEHFTEIAYSNDRVASITAPEPSTGASRPQRSYSYTVGTDGRPTQTDVNTAGLSPAPVNGYARRVQLDGAGHATASYDQAGIATEYFWDNLHDLPIGTIDHHYQANPTAGLATTTVYDAAWRPTDTYGPAVAAGTGAVACFNMTTGKPVTPVPSGCEANPPHATSTYDGGMPGLNAAWHANEDLAGPSAAHSLSTGVETWGASSPAGIPADRFSGRLTGEAKLGQTGSHLTIAADGARVYVDDKLQGDTWGGPYRAAVNADRPIDYWRLGESLIAQGAKDSAGASHGTYTPTGVTLGAAGVLAADSDTAATFNGSTGYVNVPNDAQLGFEWDDAFTLEAWVKTTGAAAQTIVAKMPDSGTYTGYDFFVLSGQPYVQLIDDYGAGEAIKVHDTRTVNDGNWHHLAATYNGSRAAAGVTLYIDGVANPPTKVVDLDGLTTMSTIGNSVGVTLGSRQGGYKFAGSLDEIAVYPSALSATQLSGHYAAWNQTSTTITSIDTFDGAYQAAVKANTPSGYWRLGEPTRYPGVTDQQSAYPGTYGTGVSVAQSGALTGDTDTAAAFNGSAESYASVGDYAIYGASAVTIEAWFKTTSSGPIFGYQSVDVGVTPTGGWVPSLYVGTDGKLRGTMWPAPQIISPATVNNGAWHHAVLTNTGSAQTLYLDGLSAGTSSGGFSWLNMGKAQIGAAFTAGWGAMATPGTGWWNFNGTIDDVAVYRSALNATQVGDHYSARSAAPAASTATHRIRIDYQELNGNANLTLTTPAGTVLSPRYNLVTQTVDADGKVDATEYSSPWRGQPTASVVDPTGLNLRTLTGYESPGSSSYLRRTSRTLPAGGQTTYDYYSQGTNAATATDPCGTIAGNIPQGGGLWKTTDAAGRVTEARYDSAGRTIGTRIDSDAWTCTTYDPRGRPTKVNYQPDGRTVGYDYAVDIDGAGGPVPANPAMTAMCDNSVAGSPAPLIAGPCSGKNGVIQTTVDWLGRVISYTDVWGKTTTTSYDQAGRVTQTLTAGAGGATIATTYDAAGRTATQQLGGKVVAQPTYDANSGVLTSVSYPSGSGNGGNGTSGAFTYDSRGRMAGITWTGPGATTLTSDQVTSRSAAGDILDQSIDGTDPRPAGPNYVYDAAGRLTNAWVPGHNYVYAYASTGGCGANTAAGKNTNRTSLTVDGGTPITYCYDNADRLTSTSDAAVGTPGYDGHGNTTGIYGEVRTYDSADRHLTTFKSGTTITYVRDATDRIVSRSDGTTTIRYSSSATGDAPDYTLDSSNNVIELTLGLVGGVLYTDAATDTWSYPNIHGDVAAVANSSGVKQGSTFIYDPYGKALGGLPDNTAGAFDYGWLGQHQRPLEHQTGLAPTIEMGARQYDPNLGRFLEVDPIEGGTTTNDYAYVPDPVNQFDLNGQGLFGIKCKLCGKAVNLAKKAAIQSAKITRIMHDTNYRNRWLRERWNNHTTSLTGCVPILCFTAYTWRDGNGTRRTRTGLQWGLTAVAWNLSTSDGKPGKYPTAAAGACVGHVVGVCYSRSSSKSNSYGIGNTGGFVLIGP